MVSYILIAGYSVLLFMNPLNFKFLQVPVNLLAAVNFADVFLKIENVWKIKNVKKRDQNKKNAKKTFFYVYE